MKYTCRLSSRFAIACLLSVISTGDVFARGGRGGRGDNISVSRSESYGSVRQSAYHSSAATGDGQVSYDRQATGPEGRTASRSGDATRGDGQVSWNREATGPGGKSAEGSGDATAGDGQVSVNRQATGPNGGTVSSRDPLRVGSRVTTLPAGYSTVSVRGVSYYYCDGYYYQPTDADGDYVVVKPPVGVVCYQLPEGVTMEVTVGGVHYFTDGDVYYCSVYVNGQTGYISVAPPQVN
jgi:hypothetical protein